MNSLLLHQIRVITFTSLACCPALSVAETAHPYTQAKVNEAKAIINEFKDKMTEFAATVDQEEIKKEVQANGEPDETKTRFLPLQLPLMKAVDATTNAVKELGYKMTVQTGAFTATDVVPAVIDRETGELKGFCIIKRRDKNKQGEWVETYATIGGFHEYGLTYAQNGAKEAKEEAELNVPVSTMKLAGVFDDPKRDARQHVASIAYVGATYDMPKETPEARQVLVVKPEELPEGPWFASDHGVIVKACIEMYKKNEAEIIAALKASQVSDTSAVSAQ